MESLVSVELFQDYRIPLLGLRLDYNDEKLKHKQADALDGILQSGYRHIQLDSRYADEDVVNTLKKWIPEKIDREDIFISVKMRVENVGLRKVNVRSNVLQSLQTFELDYIDCVMLDLTATDETNDSITVIDEDSNINVTTHKRAIESMSILVSEEKCRCWGVKHNNVINLQQLLTQVKYKPSIIQVAVGLYNQNFERFRKYCQYKQIPLLVEIPQKISHNKQFLPFFKALEEISEQRHKSQQQILTRLCISLGVATLCVSSTVQHAKLNFQVFDFGLTSQEVAQLTHR